MQIYTVLKEIFFMRVDLLGFISPKLSGLIIWKMLHVREQYVFTSYGNYTDDKLFLKIKKKLFLSMKIFFEINKQLFFKVDL